MQEEWVGFVILQMNCKEVEKDFRPIEISAFRLDCGSRRENFPAT
jgi:hypothetical protein